jgi:glutamate carboxypeptidase
MIDFKAASQVLDDLKAHEASMVDDLRRVVEIETPTDRKPLLDRFAEQWADKAVEFGASSVELLPETDAGSHVLARWDGDSELDPVLILGHYDTVWPEGTLLRLPFRGDGQRLFGPGIFDMKAGLIIALWALRASRLMAASRPIVLLVTSDEEVGSPSSRPLIEENARRAAFSLVFEPALEDGSLKTSRRGLTRYHFAVTGRASHSGLAATAGISAIEELCGLILQLPDVANGAAGIDINPGVISGGSRYNVVAAHAECEVAVRTRTAAEAEQVDRVISAFRTKNPAAHLQIERELLWPPMERTPRIGSLAERAREVAAQLGVTLGEGLSGGSSDACHCAAVGAAVIDGLGAVGGGAHADDEHVMQASLPERAAVAACLIASLHHDSTVQPDVGAATSSRGG